MQIDRVQETEHAEFLSLVNAEIRPDRAKTTAWDDFPLILGQGNRDCQLVCRAPDGRLAGGIACLIRDLKTNCGNVKVAGIGSVVTHPEYRGKGLSTALQNEMLTLIRGKNVPLAVLWTDRPEIYAGRGFFPAGWEIHAHLDDFRLPLDFRLPPRIRDFRPEDTARVEELYSDHPLHTIRRSGDSAVLYGMPGTRGLVAVDEEDQVQAAVFCGKGADFPLYVAEFGGPQELVLHLLARAKELGLARNILLPPGQEEMVNTLVSLGASWSATSSGYWNILDRKMLGAIVARSGQESPRPGQDPAREATAWLGGVDGQGQPFPGPLTLAVWGFDSV